MAVKHGGHATTCAYVVSTTEDFCKSPTAPAGYIITQLLKMSDFTCGSVFHAGTELLNLNSRVLTVTGNEAGVGGGVVSSVNRGMCKPVRDYAKMVCAEGQPVLRHGTKMEMNCSSVDGPGNTDGILMYITAPKKPTTPPPYTPIDRSLQEWMWVDIDWNDLATVGVALLASPMAILLQPLAALFPETIGNLVKMLPKTSAGTGDKSGVGGPIIGDNSGDGTPGMVGLSVSLAHWIMQLFGGDGGVKFEKGQGLEGHNGKTGVGRNSVWYLSFGETIGQLLGIAVRWLGDLLGLPLGDLFFQLVEFVFGPSNGYGFVAGVWKGTWQTAAQAGPMCI